MGRYLSYNYFLADDFKESFYTIFKKRLIPTQPFFYVNVHSRIDPTASPPDTDAILVLVPVGYQNSFSYITLNSARVPARSMLPYQYGLRFQP